MKKRLVRWKMYLDRSRMYTGYVQFFSQMWSLLILISIKIHISIIDNHIVAFGMISFIIFIVGSLAIGRWDYKSGFFHEENRRHSEANPINQELLDRLRRIEENQNKRK